MKIQKSFNASLLSTEERNSNPSTMVGRQIATVPLGTENPLIECLPDSIKVSESEFSRELSFISEENLEKIKSYHLLRLWLESLIPPLSKNIYSLQGRSTELFCI